MGVPAETDAGKLQGLGAALAQRRSRQVPALGLFQVSASSKLATPVGDQSGRAQSRANNEVQTLFLRRYTFMIGDVRISECRSLGDVNIYDLSAMRVGHLAKLTPAILKKAEVAATVSIIPLRRAIRAFEASSSTRKMLTAFVAHFIFVI